jgi:DNA polymerase-3 subunit alpha/error-prone DNA polymerase
VGVFQIESRAQMSLLPRLKPRNYYDLVIEVAIVRPGPIQGGMIHPFLKRREKLEAVTYAHPKLEKVLKRTLGIPLFQEQIMQIVVEAADFSPGEADQMRRIMSNAWRKQAQMDGVREKLTRGMRKNGIKDTYIESIYKTIEGFAAYGFPESHAASFALLTYVSCYLKCHYPDAFVCALLNSQPMGFYGPRALINEAQRNGVKFKNPSVQYSQLDSFLEKDPHDPAPKRQAVRLGLATIQGLPASVFGTIVSARPPHGAYQDIHDFIQRTQLSAAMVSKLALAGALTDLGLSPREALWKIPTLQFDQDSLFFAREKTTPEASWSPPPASEWEELMREYKTTGYSVDRHPLLLMRPHLKRLNAEYKKRGYGLLFIASNELKNLKDRSTVRFAGLLSVQQKPPTSKGVSFLTLEDEFGFFNVVLMPKIYEQSRLMIRTHPLIEIVGRLEKVQGVYNVIATQVRPAPAMPETENPDQQNPDYKHLKPRFFH